MKIQRVPESELVSVSIMLPKKRLKPWLHQQATQAEGLCLRSP